MQATHAGGERCREQMNIKWQEANCDITITMVNQTTCSHHLLHPTRDLQMNYVHGKLFVNLQMRNLNPIFPLTFVIYVKICSYSQNLHPKNVLQFTYIDSHKMQ